MTMRRVAPIHPSRVAPHRKGCTHHRCLSHPEPPHSNPRNHNPLNRRTPGPRPKPPNPVALELADPLARQAEFVGDCLEGGLVGPAQSEPLHNDSGLPRREHLAEIADQAFTDRIDDSLQIGATDHIITTAAGRTEVVRL